MTGERSDFEDEVRSLVARVLAGVIDGPVDASESPDSSEGASPVPEPGGRIAMGSDHGGFELKENLKTQLVAAGWSIDDCGTNSTDACDYPVFAHAVARQVAMGNCVAGIMIDGAGIGSAMAANKVPGIRAAACYDLSTARNSREHNRANLLTLGAGLTGAALAWQIVQEWLATPWGRGRHHKRVTLINEIESTYIRSEA